MLAAPVRTARTAVPLRGVRARGRRGQRRGERRLLHGAERGRGVRAGAPAHAYSFVLQQDRSHRVSCQVAPQAG
eukprot:7354724-Alexandrium_andersonii.AAC.1